MAAYSVDIAQRCRRCGGRAHKEVFNSFNASLGIFCQRCAAARVKELNRSEASDVRRATQIPSGQTTEL
jgi:hypothetical protein